MGRSRKTKNEVSGWDIISFFLLIFTTLHLIISSIMDLLKAIVLSIIKIVEWFKNRKSNKQKQIPLPINGCKTYAQYRLRYVFCIFFARIPKAWHKRNWIFKYSR